MKLEPDSIIQSVSKRKYIKSPVELDLRRSIAYGGTVAATEQCTSIFI
jgi:hypothetical protein